MKSHPILPFGVIALLALATSGLSPAADIQSQALTEKIYRGSGVIDLLKDIDSKNLASYFNQTGGLLLLGADLNEDSSGNESNKSIGVAIREAQLQISTSEGDFTFKDFYTSTSAKLREAGQSSDREFFTLFGQGGSSQITGSGKLDISRFDDVMWFEDIDFKGEIKSAKLSISLLSTPSSKPTAGESFFDFSGGFEDFALFNVADAVLLEEAQLGVAGAPSGVKFETEDNAVEAIKDAIKDPSGSGNDDVVVTEPAEDVANGGLTPVTAPPAAPAPPFIALASMGALMVWKKRRQRQADVS